MKEQTVGIKSSELPERTKMLHARKLVQAVLEQKLPKDRLRSTAEQQLRERILNELVGRLGSDKQILAPANAYLARLGDKSVTQIQREAEKSIDFMLTAMRSKEIRSKARQESKQSSLKAPDTMDAYVSRVTTLLEEMRPTVKPELFPDLEDKMTSTGRYITQRRLSTDDLREAMKTYVAYLEDTQQHLVRARRVLEQPISKKPLKASAPVQPAQSPGSFRKQPPSLMERFKGLFQ